MATKKKYEFTGEQKHYDGITLNRIRALVNIPKYGVKAGDLGGWIQSETTFRRTGNAGYPVMPGFLQKGASTAMPSSPITHGFMVMPRSLAMLLYAAILGYRAT